MEGESRALKHLRFAKEGLGLGQYVYALELCKWLLLKEPECIEGWRALRMASKAIYEGRLGLRRMFVCVKSYLCIIGGYLFRGERQMKLLQEGVCEYPKNRVGLILLGQYAWEREHWGMLLFAYEELYSLFPEKVSYGLRLGNLYLNLGQYKRAVELGEKLLSQDPSNMEVMNLVEQGMLAEVGGNSGFKIA